MRIKVDEELCVGCGLCEESLPILIEMGRHYAVLKLSQIPDEYLEAVREATGDCPVSALSLQNEDGRLSSA